MFFLLRVPAAVPVAAALLVASCSWTPPAPSAGPDPADANVQVDPVTDVSVRGAYQSFYPVAPRGWREQNERVAPQPRP